MTNVALNKRIEERIKDPNCALDGQVDNYSALNGFAEFQYPGYLTLDLKECIEIVCIRILLWDGLGQGGEQADGRTYKYRLLLSQDHQNWSVICDTGDKGYNGWQVFNFKQKTSVRYLRIHGLHNSANSKFQIVQIEAHDSDPPELNRKASLIKEIKSEFDEGEISDGLPFASKFHNIANSIESLVESNPLLNPEPFKNLIFQMRQQVHDVEALENSMASIRREITEPVKKELEQSTKLGKYSVWGFFVGIIGFIFAIFSLINNLVPIVKSEMDKILVQKVDSISHDCKELQSKIENTKETQSYRWSSINPLFMRDYVAKAEEGTVIKLGNDLWVHVTNIHPDGSANISFWTTSGSVHGSSVKPGDNLDIDPPLSASSISSPRHIRILEIDKEMKIVTFSVSGL